MKNMFKPVEVLENDTFSIPILGSDINCFILWKDNIEWYTALSSMNLFPGAQCSFNVWNMVDVDKDDGATFFVYVYEVKCCNTEENYYLISWEEIQEYDDILHSVCVPYNKLNLLSFFKEYLLPFDGKNFFFG